MIDLLQQKLGSMTKALEILYVKEGAKPTARIIVDEEKADELIKYMEGEKYKCVEIRKFKLLTK